MLSFGEAFALNPAATGCLTGREHGVIHVRKSETVLTSHEFKRGR
jgi:hypothetical protein